MKKLVLLLALAVSLGEAMAQHQQTLALDLPAIATKKIPGTDISKDEKFTITGVVCDMSKKSGFDYLLNVKDDKGEESTLQLNVVKGLPMEVEVDSKEAYWQFRTIQYSLPSLTKMSNAYSLRADAENAANKYISLVNSESLVFEDPMLTSYIYSLLAKINPIERLDFFKYNFRVVVVNAIEPNAAIYPNGTLVINAGILARLKTEDELVALLCHEANHFICNHYLENMAEIQRKQIAGAIGGAILGVATGVLTGSAGAASSAMSLTNSLNNLITSMGMAFDQDQEKESDQAAVDLLPILGYDANAMATCIKRIGDYYIEEGNLAAYYRSGKHPKIEDRIAATGIPFERSDSTYGKNVAGCVSFLANYYFTKGRYSQALECVERNVRNNSTKAVDYYLRGQCLLNVSNTQETNLLAKESLLKAGEIFKNDVLLQKSLIVAHMRLGEKEEARNLLQELSGWSHAKDEERMWATNMLLNL